MEIRDPNTMLAGMRFVGTEAQYRRYCQGLKILQGINSRYQQDDHGNVSMQTVRAYVCRAMFDKDMSYIVTKRRYHSPTRYQVSRKNTTADEDAVIEKVIRRMESKGVIRINAAGNSCKPLLSVIDYMRQNCIE